MFPLDGKYLSLEGVSEKRKKISSPNQKISIHKQKLPPPNFKSFNNALNKKLLFPMGRKSVSTSRNEEFVKKYKRKNCFHSQEYLTNGKNSFSLARKTVPTRSKEVFL